MRGFIAGAVITAVVFFGAGVLTSGDLGTTFDWLKTEATKKADQVKSQETPTKGATRKVTRVIDGDTVELGNGDTVRIVGIDTPERGQCGYERATKRMESLVLGKTVTLGKVRGNETDRYGRIIRYVDVAGRDAGLAQIRGGVANARYDSTDGYPKHPRERAYHRATDNTRHVCKEYDR